MKKILNNKKGFTLVELLAVIVIMAILLMIAIPSISSILYDSRSKLYVQDASTYVTAAKQLVTDQTFTIDDYDTTYYIHINNLTDQSKIRSPFSEWLDAYVVVTLNEDGTKDYYWVSCDKAGWKIDLKEDKLLNQKDVYNGKKYVNNRQPVNGRSKIVIIDKDGYLTEATPRLGITEDEAKACFSFRNTSDTEAELTYYNKDCGTDVVIPAMIGDREVTSIYQYTFRNMGITSVYIPDTIKTIGTSAFSNNNLVSLYILSTVLTIGNGAFNSNKLTSLTIEEGVKTIGANSFKNNKLTEAVIPNSASSIGSCAYCDNPIPNPSFLYVKNGSSYDYSRIRGYMGDLSEFSDKVFRIPEEVNGVKLKVIEDSAFSSMNLHGWEVTIPETVTSIEGSAFWGTGIVKVNLPNRLTNIGGQAFYSTKLTELKIPATVTKIGGLAFTNNNVINEEDAWIYKRTENGIDYSTLIGYAGAKRDNIVIPEERNGIKLKTIAASAFAVNYFTGTLKIPSTVTSIGTNAFELSSVTYVDNGDGNLVPGFIYARNKDGSIDYTNIIGYASMSTSNVIIPSNVKKISKDAFYYSYIKNVTLPEGLLEISSGAFALCKLGPEVVIPSTVTKIGDNAFYKVINWEDYNANLTRIVNKTGRKFDWKAITGGPTEATFEYGTVENWYGNIEVVKG